MEQPTLYFYDEETFGFNPRLSRVGQFAGQRTDLDLNPIGEPISHFIKLTEDVLPDPGSVLITGITPQHTIQEGLSEAEFLKIFHKEVVTPNTIIIGYNNIRFDDEFMRYMHYRNFYDPYEWYYQEGRSRWDLLDMIRMMRALRPKGINWPVNEEGKASNRLDLITGLNDIEHGNAHEASSDVWATIALARLVKERQPKLYNYLFGIRDKGRVEQLVLTGEPFVYSSGEYSSDILNTTVAIMVAQHPNRRGALVYDLREDPAQFKDLSVDELSQAWKRRRDEQGLHLSVKTLLYNKCPAVAPLRVLDEASQKRLGLDMDKVAKHAYELTDMSDWKKRLGQALKIIDEQWQTTLQLGDRTVDEKLYDAFIDDHDRPLLPKVRTADPKDLSNFIERFKDPRLRALLPLYKARNFPDALTDEERVIWERHRHQSLFGGGEASQAAKFSDRLNELSAEPNLTSRDQYLLEELRLYAESIAPTEAF